MQSCLARSLFCFAIFGTVLANGCAQSKLTADSESDGKKAVTKTVTVERIFRSDYRWTTEYFILSNELPGIVLVGSLEKGLPTDYKGRPNARDPRESDCLWLRVLDRGDRITVKFFPDDRGAGTIQSIEVENLFQQQG